MADYFYYYPKVYYSLWNNKKIQPKVVTDILARAEVIPSVIIDNTAIYYLYNVKDGERQETLAYKYYGDVEAQWILAYFNNVIDPYYDWPMMYEIFVAYIINKYGSVAAAQSQVSSYQKIIQKVDSASGDTTIDTYTIDETTYNNLPEFNFQTVNLPNGQAVQITTTTQIVYAYEQELTDNENLRTIKILDKSYYGQILSEFQDIFNSP